MILWIKKSGCKKTTTLKQSLLQNKEGMIHLIDQRYPTEENKLSDRFRPLSSPYTQLVSVKLAYKWWGVKKEKKILKTPNTKQQNTQPHPLHYA